MDGLVGVVMMVDCYSFLVELALATTYLLVF